MPRTDTGEIALDTTQDVLVSAGAGSGKTHRLVQRYLRALSDRPELGLEHIVAFTFTEKAAAEMRERVRREVGKYMLDGSRPPEERARWKAIWYSFDSARISTVHSFCRDLLSRYALDAGVDPAFEVLDEVEASRLRRGTVRRLLRRISNDPESPHHEPLKSLVQRFGINGLEGHLLKLLEQRWVTERACRLMLDRNVDEIVALWRKDATRQEVPERADRGAAELGKALAGLYEPLVKEYENAKRNGLYLDFEDLELGALRLLDDPEVRETVHAQICHLLVDEFQDTNPVQEELVRRLAGEACSLFFVGDAKQSIYAFRGADVRVFRRAIRSGEMRVASEGLTRRSLPAIVGFVNAFFGGLLVESPEAPWEVGFEPLKPLRRDRDGSVEINVVKAEEDEEEETSDLREREADAVARWILAVVDEKGPLSKMVFDKEKEIWRPAQYRDIAILLRARTYLTIYEKALARHGIPYEVWGGVGFFQQQEVLDIWNLLRFLTRPGDDIALFGVLRSPIGGISDETLLRLSRVPGRTLWDRLLNAVDRLKEGNKEKPLSSLDDAEAARLEKVGARLRLARLQMGRIPVDTALCRILDESGAWAGYACTPRGKQAVANLRKTLAIIRALEQEGNVLPADIAAHFTDQIEQEQREGEAAGPGGGEGVRVMTVHGAKGLEFPIVCVVNTDKSFNLGRDAQLLVDAELGILPMAMDTGPDGRVEAKPSSGLQKCKRRRESETIAEEKRLLYVAATRARDHLLISGVDIGRKHRNGSWLDWLTGYEELPGLKIAVQNDGVQYKSHSGQCAVGLTDPSRLPAAQVTEICEPIEPRPTDGSVPAEMPEELLPVLRRWDGPELGHKHAPSELVVFSECPLKYYYRVRCSIPEWEMFHRGTDPESEMLRRRALHAQRLGLILHRVLEALPRARTGNLPQLVECVCTENLLPAATFKEEALRILERLKGTELWRRLSTDEGMESEFRFDLEMGQEVVEGVIDRFSVDEDRALVIDFKTIKVREEDGRVRRDYIEQEKERHRAQLETYALAIAEAYGIPPGKVEADLVFMDIPDRPERVAAADLKPDVKRLLQEVRSAIVRGRFRPKEIGDAGSRERACRECGFWQNGICVERRAGGM